MGRKPKIQCRIERDTDESIRAYRDELDDDISQSEAVRHLLRAGLAAKGHPVAATDGGGPGPLERIASRQTAALGALLLGLSLIPLWTAATATTTTTALVALGLAAIPMGLGVATIWAATLAQLALARPLRSLLRPTDPTGNRQ